MCDNDNNVLCISIGILKYWGETLYIFPTYVRARQAILAREQTLDFVFCQKGSRYSTLDKSSSEPFPHVLDPILKISQLFGCFIIMAQLCGSRIECETPKNH